MAFIHETFEFYDNFRFYLFQTSDKQKELHCHDCLELNLAEQGEGTYIIGGKLYPIRKGDIFVINNREHHLALHGEEGLTLTVLVFDPEAVWKSRYGKEYLKPFLYRSKSFSNRITAQEEGYGMLLPAFNCLKQEAEGKRTGWQMVMEASIQLLLSLLYRYYNEKQEIKEEDSFDPMFGRISRVFTYIDEHFAEEVTLDQLAKETAISRNYLCKCFKQMTGQTIFTYIEQVRIRYACYLLCTSQRSVADVAMESGFGSVSYFNRVFRRYCGVSPGRYRKGLAEHEPDMGIFY